MTFSHVLLLFSDRSPVPFLAKRAEPRRRGGLTLIELMVAMAVTLLLMGAVVSLFGFLGDTINNSKSDIEMLERLRQVSELLQADLANVTLQPGPPQGSREQQGFFEYVEGTRHCQTNTEEEVVSDVKDMLLFTIQSSGEPLTGKIDTTLVPIGGDPENAGSAGSIPISAGTSVSAGAGGLAGYMPGFSGRSRLGEVIWFVTVDPQTKLGRLHRYQLLVAPGANLSKVESGENLNNNQFDDLEEFLARNDISSRLQGGAVVANSLEDLAQRANRRAHQDDNNGFVPFYSFTDTTQYPTELHVAARLFMLHDLDDPGPPDDPSTLSAETQALLLSRLDETIVLDNVTKFDVKAWDPGVPFPEPGTITLFEDDFSSSTIGLNGLSRGNLGWRKANGGNKPYKWYISGGKLGNSGGSTYVYNGSNDIHGRQRRNEAALAQVILGHECATDQLSLSFDWTMAHPNERLHVHLWGFVENANPSSPGTWMMNLGASNGNAWESSGGVFDQYNLGKPNGAFTPASPRGVGGNAAAVLTGGSGSGQYSGTFNISEFTTAPNTLGCYHYLVIGFARNEYGNGDTSAVTIDNLKLEATANIPSGAYGDYVDLFPSCTAAAPGTPVPLTLSHPGLNVELKADETKPATYDSWSAAYGNLAADGYDSDNNGAVDDAGEATSAQRAPYPIPLQGIQVRLSATEPSSGTVRTVTIRQRFDN